MLTATVTNREIGFIGAIGGFVLALLKLVESQFFLNNLWSTTSGAAYLTYAVYIFFGIVVAHFFTERSLERDKAKKCAFILGLLAPSMLLAIAARPIGESGTADNSGKGIPSLESLIFPIAYAGTLCPEGKIKVPDERCIKVDVITKGAFEPTFREAFLAALGRGQVAKKYAFVVGGTTDAEKATKVAEMINNAVLKKASTEVGSAKVVKVKGGETLFITVGDLSSAAKARQFKTMAETAAIDALTADSNPETRKSAGLLLKGKIIEAHALFRSKM